MFDFFIYIFDCFIFSPFEESRIFSLYWFFSYLYSVDLLIGNSFFFYDLFSTNNSFFSYFFSGFNFFFFYSFFDFSFLNFSWELSDISSLLSLFCMFSFSHINLNLENNYNIVLSSACILSSSCCAWLSLRNKIGFTFFHTISDFVYSNMILPYLGNSGKRYFPFFLYLFFFIFFSNFLGLIPGFFALTSHLSVTLFLSSICWLSILFVGLYMHGFRFFASFFPSKVPFALSPFLMFIEFISYWVRLASLSLRLFANIVAGHILLDTISMFFFYMDMSVDTCLHIEKFAVGFFLWFFLFVMILFELIIAILQAYIFVVLAVIYLNDSIHLHV